MSSYCLLLTVSTSNLTGNVDSAQWVSPDDTKFTKSPGKTLQKFYKGDSVSVAFQVLDKGAPTLPQDIAIAAIVTPKKNQPNASPYRFIANGVPASGNRLTMLLGSIKGEGAFSQDVSILDGFDSNGNQGGWDGSTFLWIGFKYPECLLFHDSDTDSNFELTVSARMSGSLSWAYDPEMDVGKKNK